MLRISMRDKIFPRKRWDTVQASHVAGVRAEIVAGKRSLLAGQSVCGFGFGGTLDGFAPFFGLVPESVK